MTGISDFVTIDLSLNCETFQKSLAHHSGFFINCYNSAYKLCTKIYSYFSRRQISVSLSIYLFCSINIGVPQRILLEPPLFFFNINNHLSLTSNSIHSYGDVFTLHSNFQTTFQFCLQQVIAGQCVHCPTLRKSKLGEQNTLKFKASRFKQSYCSTKGPEH